MQRQFMTGDLLLENIVAIPAQIMEAFILVTAKGKIKIDRVLSMEVVSETQVKIKGWFLPETISSIKEGPGMT
jgi:hypothetical protein